MNTLHIIYNIYIIGHTYIYITENPFQIAKTQPDKRIKRSHTLKDSGFAYLSGRDGGRGFFSHDRDMLPCKPLQVNPLMTTCFAFFRLAAGIDPFFFLASLRSCKLGDHFSLSLSVWSVMLRSSKHLS